MKKSFLASIILSLFVSGAVNAQSYSDSLAPPMRGFIKYYWSASFPRFLDLPIESKDSPVASGGGMGIVGWIQTSCDGTVTSGGRPVGNIAYTTEQQVDVCVN